MTAPKPLTEWQAAHTPAALPRHIRRNIAPAGHGCWQWTASLSRDGYGWASLDDKTYQAHRLVYILLVGEPPAGLVLDHLCRNRACVNPAPLEPVTSRENLRQGNTPTGWDKCQRCGSDYIRLRTQRRCPRCLAAYREARKTRRKAGAR